MSRDGIHATARKLRTARPTFLCYIRPLRRDGSYEIGILACDGAESFNQCLTLCAIIDHEGVVFAMR